MNNLVLGLLVLISACGVAVAALLPALVEHSRHTAAIEAGRLNGPGADFLRALGRDSQFVLIAEDHGVAGIAEFTDAYWRDLNETGFEYLAIETDPWVSAVMERKLRAGGVEALSRFLAEGGEAYLSNMRRETLMKQQFLKYYRAVEKKSRTDPRVLFKFGAYHMYRGATPTHVQGLGGFISEFAVANDSAAVSVWMVCGPGSFVRSGDEEIPCTDWFNREFEFLAPYTATDGLTIFDLRSWRMRPGRWTHLPESIRQGVRSFDVMVVVAGSPPATVLPGLE